MYIYIYVYFYCAGFRVRPAFILVGLSYARVALGSSSCECFQLSCASLTRHHQRGSCCNHEHRSGALATIQVEPVDYAISHSAPRAHSHKVARSLNAHSSARSIIVHAHTPDRVDPVSSSYVEPLKKYDPRTLPPPIHQRPHMVVLTCPPYVRRVSLYSRKSNFFFFEMQTYDYIESDTHTHRHINA